MNTPTTDQQAAADRFVQAANVVALAVSPGWESDIINSVCAGQIGQPNAFAALQAWMTTNPLDVAIIMGLTPDELRKNFARFIAPLYLENRAEIARVCDEEIDQSGALLGYVREAARLLEMRPTPERHEFPNNDIRCEPKE